MILRRITRVIACLLVIISSSLSILVSHPALAAGTANLYLSPASSSVIDGDTLTVNIYESSSASVNVVSAYLNYPTGLLSYTGYSDSSGFDTDAPPQPSLPDTSGTLGFHRGATPPVSGTQLVVSVRFTALQSSGTATLSFGSSSDVVDDSSETRDALTTTGATYTLAAPAAGPSSPAPSGSSGTPSSNSSSSTKSSTSSKSTPSSSSSSSSKSTSTPTTTQTTAGTPSPISISGLKATAISATDVNITWQTSVAGSSEVYYGTSQTYGLSVINNSLVTSHSLTLDPKGLVPNTTYHFIVKSVDGSGDVASSPDMTVRTVAATATPKAASKTSTWILAVVGIIVLAALAAGGIMFQKRLALQKEINEHFPKTPGSSGTPASTTPSPTTTGSSGPVITPSQPPDDINKKL